MAALCVYARPITRPVSTPLWRTQLRALPACRTAGSRSWFEVSAGYGPGWHGECAGALPRMVPDGPGEGSPGRHGRCTVVTGALVLTSRAKGDAMHLPTLSRGGSPGAVALASAVALMPVAAFAPPAPRRAGARGRHAALRHIGLVVWLDVPPGNLTGGAAYDLEFTNLSGHACTLRGYPGSQRSASAAARSVARRAGAAPRPHRPLASGATATAACRRHPRAYATRCLCPRHGSSHGGRGRRPPRPGCASTRPTSPRRN